MLTRVCLIAAIVFGVAVSAINLIRVRDVIVTVTNQRDSEQHQKEQALSELAQTRQELDTTKTDLAQTKQTLDTTTAERDTLRASNDALVKQNRTLDQNLQKTTQQRNDAQAELAAWKALGITVDQVKVVIATAKQAQEALKVAQAENRSLSIDLARVKNELARYQDPKYVVPLPEGLRGTVLAADPKWQFVVLNVGANDRVLKGGELLVNRNGRLVAKLVVQSVQNDRSIANLVDGWQLGDVMEGDVVIPAH